MSRRIVGRANANLRPTLSTVASSTGRIRRPMALIAVTVLSAVLAGCSAGQEALKSTTQGPLVMTRPQGAAGQLVCAESLTAGMVACGGGAEVTNNSKSPQGVSGSGYAKLDDGRTFADDPTSIAATFFGTSGYVSATLNPGETKSWRFAFELPKGTRIKKIFIGTAPDSSVVGMDVDLPVQVTPSSDSAQNPGSTGDDEQAATPRTCFMSGGARC